MDAPKKRGSQPRWTEAEDAILRATYPDGGKRAWAELHQAGANRSQMAVYLRARELGLKVTRNTTE